MDPFLPRKCRESPRNLDLKFQKFRGTLKFLKISEISEFAEISEISGYPEIRHVHGAELWTLLPLSAG